MDKSLIWWAARNRHLVKPSMYHCPVKNGEFHELVKLARAKLNAGYVGVDVCLESAGQRSVKRFKYA